MVRFLPDQTFPLNLQVKKKTFAYFYDVIILYESLSITA